MNFKNPLQQNYCHTQALERLPGLPSPVFHSVIVFAGDCELKSDFPDNVCTKADLNAYIDSFTQKVFPKQQVQAIAQAIEKHRLPPTRDASRPCAIFAPNSSKKQSFLSSAQAAPHRCVWVLGRLA